MSSFLQSLFERITPEVFRIEDGLTKRGVTIKGATDYAYLLTSGKTEAFSFDGNAVAFHRDENVAAEAFTFLQDCIRGKRFSSFSVKNVSFDRDFPGQEHWAAPGFKTEGINIADSSLSDSGFHHFFEGIPTTGASQIALRGIDCSGERAEMLADVLKKMPLTHLSLSDASIDENGFGALARSVSSLKLTHLDVSRAAPVPAERVTDTASQGFSDFLSALPGRITHLNLSGQPMDGRAVESLCRAFANLPYLEEVDMKDCGLSAGHVVQIARTLPLSVRKADLDGAGLSDAALDALIASAKRPGSRLQETNILPCVSSVKNHDPRFSAEKAAELTCTEYENRAQYMRTVQQEKAALIAKAKAGKETVPMPQIISRKAVQR